MQITTKNTAINYLSANKNNVDLYLNDKCNQQNIWLMAHQQGIEPCTKSFGGFSTSKALMYNGNKNL